jgi:hypothetical protein
MQQKLRRGSSATDYKLAVRAYRGVSAVINVWRHATGLAPRPAHLSVKEGRQPCPEGAPCLCVAASLTGPRPITRRAVIPRLGERRLDAMTIEITLTQQLQRHRERFERYGTIPNAMLPMPTTLVVRSKVGTL